MLYLSTSRFYNRTAPKYVNDLPLSTLPARTVVANVPYTAVASDHLIAYTTLTATRAITLPAAASMPNQVIVIKDEAGTAGTNNLTFVGTIDGASNPVAVSANFGYKKIYSNGTAWFSY